MFFYFILKFINISHKFVCLLAYFLIFCKSILQQQLYILKYEKDLNYPHSDVGAKKTLSKKFSRIILQLKKIQKSKNHVRQALSSAEILTLNYLFILYFC